MPKSVAEIRAELTAPGQLCEVDERRDRRDADARWKNAPPTLRAVLDLSAMHGDKPFIVYEDERLTFGEHYRAAATFAHRLIDGYGVRKGDRVAIAMRNFPEWLLAFWGATVAGAIVVPLNAWWTGPELEYGIEDSGAKVLIVDEERAQRLRPYSDMGLSGVIVGRAQHPLTDAEVGIRGRTGLGALRRVAPRRRARAGGRRDDLLHVGHDRVPEGRARHPPQHLHQRACHGVRCHLRVGAQRRVDGRRRRARCRGLAAGAAEQAVCCPCRCSTSPAATPSCSGRSASAGSS